MIFEINPQSTQAIYKQIQDQIILGIAQNKIQLGELLPSVRQLSDELGINPMTVSKAYRLLSEDGYLVTDGRKGTVIAQVPLFSVEEKKAYLQQLAFTLAIGHLRSDKQSKLFDEITQIMAEFNQERDSFT